MLNSSAFTRVLIVCTSCVLSAPTWAQTWDTSGFSVAVGDVPAAEVSYRMERLASGLKRPSAITFLPDGRFVLAERDLGLTLVEQGSTGSRTAPIGRFPDFYVGGQAGVHDLALHPDFAENQLIYVSYSIGTQAANATQLMRAKLNLDTLELSQHQVLFTRMPMSATSAHYGGRILFLPDKTLLLTLGEGYRYMQSAQALDNHFGKVVRLNDDGSVPADNPFVAVEGALAEIYSYGHRNPQGLILTQDGSVLLHEHGPRGGDEINLLKAGANYGWPAITYGVDYSGAIISEDSARDGMEQSLVHFIPSIAPSGFTQYQGDEFPDWQGDLLLGGLVSRQVRRIDVTEQGLGQQYSLFTELNARIRDVDIGPDGAIYFVTDDTGEFWRVVSQ